MWLIATGAIGVLGLNEASESPGSGPCAGRVHAASNASALKERRTATAARTLRAWYHDEVRFELARRQRATSIAFVSIALALCACARAPQANVQAPSSVALSSHAPTTPATPNGAAATEQLAAASPAGGAEPRALPTPRSAHERGWLGVELGKRAANEPGVLVRDVVRGSPAEHAGLVAGDVIVSVDGENVARPEDVSSRIAARSAGERVRVGLLRAQETRLLAVGLEAFPDSDEILRRQYVGLRAPELEDLEVAQGALEPRLAALRGKVVVLEFWASWCGPCHLLSPVLEQWHERFTPQGVVVAGVAAEDMSVVTRSAYQLGIAYPVFADPNGTTTKAYRAIALPTVFVLDKAGTVRDVMVGYSTPGLSRLESLVKRLIAES